MSSAEKRAEAERLRAQERRREKLRASLYLALVVAVVLGVAAALFLLPYLKERNQVDRIKKLPIDTLGSSPEAAGCRAPVTQKVDLPVDRHVDNGTALTYDVAPPAFGLHWRTPLRIEDYRTFFAADRPAKEQLVHSLEHGYTVIWYDATLAADSAELDALKAVMAEFRVKDAVVAAPWTAADGGAFPSGPHLALTHWSVKGSEKGVWRYCAGVSGAAIKSFVVDYPHSDGPEGGFA